MPASIDLKKPHRPIRVGVILMDSVTEILDVAPLDVFSGLSKHFVDTLPMELLTDEQRAQALDVDFHWVSESGQSGQLTAGATIVPTHSFANCPPLDIALMGANVMQYTPKPSELEFVRKTYEDCAAFLFICGGFLVGLQAGLFEGKTATAPRPLVENLKKEAPGVNWVAKRWANDGKIWTSGALLNGTDMMREFVTQIWGGEGTLTEFAMRLGGYPVRDVNYADVPWVI